MIETATAFSANAAQDAEYGLWRTSVKKAVMRLDPTERTAGPIPAFGQMVHDNPSLGHAYAPSSTEDKKAYPDIAYKDTKDEGFSFEDVIDIINPLQHLPVIGSLYRKFTGDTIKPMSNIIGGAIFGGPVGAIASTANVIVKDRTGKDVAENALSFMGFDSAPSKMKTEISYAETAFEGHKNMAVANLYERGADGRKSFSGKNNSTISWNA